MIDYRLCSSYIGGTPMHTPSHSTHNHESVGKKLRPSAAMFTPPEKTPERKDWIPDHKRNICMVCQRERFTMVSDRAVSLKCNSKWKIFVSFIIECFLHCFSLIAGTTADAAAGWCAMPAPPGRCWWTDLTNRSEFVISAIASFTLSKYTCSVYMYHNK